MQQIVSKLEGVAISFDLLKRVAPKHCRVLLYDSLPATVNALFGRKTCVIVLYLLHNKGRTLDAAGHYSLIMRRKHKPLFYWSSYGLRPEQEIAATHSKGKLLTLLGKYEYSRTVLQRKRHANTCGLHCLARSYLYKLNNSAYSKMMTSRFISHGPDDLVSAMCLLLVSDELIQKHKTLQ